MAVFIAGHAYAQVPDKILPEVGKPMPDFYFNDVEYYQSKIVSLKDFRGNWLILDCWSAHCGTCLESMPKMDTIRKKFLDEAEVLLVGYTGSQYVKKSDNLLVRKLYESNRKTHKLDLPIVYDSLFVHRFDIWTVPYMVIVDPKGIVKAITYKITAENIQDLFSGKEVDLPKTYTKTERHSRIKEKYKNKVMER